MVCDRVVTGLSQPFKSGKVFTCSHFTVGRTVRSTVGVRCPSHLDHLYLVGENVTRPYAVMTRAQSTLVARLIRAPTASPALEGLLERPQGATAIAAATVVFPPPIFGAVELPTGEAVRAKRQSSRDQSWPKAQCKRSCRGSTKSARHWRRLDTGAVEKTARGLEQDNGRKSAARSLRRGT